mmetsp:Transcript_21383/g.20549  ORF Transcript_21383/g.20549 Transcript_21383/m.20549 type:complete len:119 (+) Transcript_21383:378-734(+)
MLEDPVAMKVNKDLLRLMIKSKLHFGGSVDEMDKTNSSTPLHIACENSVDLELIQILVEEGLTDVNPVNNDGKLPLGLLKERLEKEVDEAKKVKLGAIYQYLEGKNGALDWKSALRND